MHEQSTAFIGTLTPRFPRTDPAQQAREHIRAALRDLAALNTTINAYACDDQFGQPNAATDAMDELDLALDALSRVAS